MFRDVPTFFGMFAILIVCAILIEEIVSGIVIIIDRKTRKN